MRCQVTVSCLRGGCPARRRPRMSAGRRSSMKARTSARKARCAGVNSRSISSSCVPPASETGGVIIMVEPILMSNDGQTLTVWPFMKKGACAPCCMTEAGSGQIHLLGQDVALDLVGAAADGPHAGVAEEHLHVVLH